jgi:protein-disulfide isomerase
MMMKFAGLFGALSMAAMLATPLAAQDEPAATDIVITDMREGNADSKVLLVEYASFTCPHCANFHAEVYSKIKPEYIDTGLINFEYREVYFDRYGLWAGMLARCGGEARYFGITDILFDKQREWAASDDPVEVVKNLKTIGRSVGMEDAAMDICLKDQATAEALLKHFQTNFEADGVEGTPTFFINGVKHSNMSYEDMKALLDAELAK